MQLILAFGYLLPAFIFIVLAVLFDGEVVDFYGALDIGASDMFLLALGYLCLGGVVYACIRKLGSNELGSNLILQCLIPFLLFGMVFLNGGLQVFSFALFLICISHVYVSKFIYFILAALGIYALLFLGERYLIVWIGMSYAYQRQFSSKVVFILLVACFFLFISFLQSLKMTGVGEMVQVKGAGEALVSQLSPIIINNITGLYIALSTESIIGSYVPFSKSALGVEGLADVLSREHLPDHIFESGTRLGSVSSIYFNEQAFSHLIVILVAMIVLKYLYRALPYVRGDSVFLLYFVFYAPYFIRRSIGVYLIDLILIFAVLCSLSFFLVLVKQTHRPKYRIKSSDILKEN